MANLFKTMEGAAQRLPAVTRPVSPRSPPIATAPAVSNELEQFPIGRNRLGIHKWREQ